MANYRQAVEQAKKDIQDIVNEMRRLDEKILETNKKAAAMGGIFGGGSVSAEMTRTNQLLQEQVTLTKQLTDVATKQAAAQDALRKKREELAQITQLEKVETAALNQQKRLEALATSKLVGAYQNLIAQHRIKRKELRDAIAQEKQNVLQIRQLQEEYRKLTLRLNAANMATRNFSRGSLTGAVAGLRNLAAAFGFVGGAFLAADLIGRAFTLTKTLQSLNFALITVTKTQLAFGRAQEFVSEISNNFGANIISVTQRYTKFLAAARQSGVVMNDTEKIFGTVTKAAGVLGLKTDELTGVYLALEQMMSKGKVTTEELRRQLGERLPGAFGIMADALGVSIPKLDEMLKKGQVMSSDVLPKFAEELERAYGLENVKRIDTIVAAQNRLSNAFTEMVQIFVNGNASAGIIAVFDGIAVGVQYLNFALEKLGPYFKSLGDAISFSIMEFKALLKELDPTGKQMELIGKIAKAIAIGPIKTLQFILRGLTIAVVGTSAAFQELFRTFSEFSLTDPIGAFTSMATVTNRMGDAFRNAQDRYAAYADKLAQQEEQKEMNALIEETATLMLVASKAAGGALTKELALAHARTLSKDGLIEYIDYLNQVINGQKKLTDEQDGAMKAAFGSLAYVKQLIAAKEEEMEKTATTSEVYGRLKKQLVELQEQYEKLSVLLGASDLPTLNIKTEGPKLFDGNKYLKEQLGIMEKQAEDALELQQRIRENTLAADRWLAEKRTEIAKGLFRTFAEYYGVDADKFTALVDAKKNTEEEWIDAAVELSQVLLNARMKQYEIELAEAQRSRDLIVNNELADEEQKELARQKFREEESRIRTERAKAERESALIAVAIDTAASVAKTLALLGPFGLPVIPIMIALGVAQAAIIAAQPIPKFKEGHLSGTHEGPAIINDANRADYREVVQRKSGEFEVYKDKNALVNLQKGDKVYKSLGDFAQRNNFSEVALMNMVYDGRQLESAISGEKMISEVAMMRKDMRSTWAEVKTLAKRPLSVKVNARVQPPKISKYV